MKVFSTIVLFCFSLTFYTQEIHFSDEENQWNVIHEFSQNSFDFPYFMAIETSTYGYCGDTIIDNSNWQKMCSTLEPNFLQANNLNLEGYVTQDESIVWYKEHADSIPYLLYDWSLEVGDSFYYELPFTSESESLFTYLFVEEIDSILVGTVYKKKYTFETVHSMAFQSLSEIWIEDVGSIHGPLFSFAPYYIQTEAPTPTHFTSCFSNSISTLWSSEDFDDCYIDPQYNSINELNENLSKVYPNPFTNQITIETPSLENIYSINIKDTNGRLLNINVNHNINKSTIDTRNLKAGIYILEIQLEQKTEQRLLIKSY